MKWKSLTSRSVSMSLPGEVLVPFPELERSVKRRTFFMNFTHAIGFLIGLPIAFPVLRYLMKPMYAPFDNQWLKIGNSGKIKQMTSACSSSSKEN
jgi:hypothetical protein